MTKLRLGRFIAAATMLVGMGAAAAASAQTITFRLGHVDNQTTHSGVGVDAFAKEVERLSNGQMKVEVFHAGKLGSIPEEIKNVLTGAQDMHLLYPEFLANIMDEAKILSAPYVFRNLEHLQAYSKSGLFQPAVDKLKAQGAVLLDPDWTWFQKDPRGLISVRPVILPADMSGLKLRIWESKTAIETWKGLGANPSVIARPEMYLAFKQGIIEGGPETIGTAVEQKNVEVAKYWTRTDEYYQIVNVMMNASRYQALNEAQRKILADAAKVGGKAYAAESERGYTEKRERARYEFGVTVIEPNPVPWRDKAKSVLAKLEADDVIPKGLAEKAMAIK
ncbi:MAG: TRAP transporter substrate-binding protein [Proteobacteria bacterium]|nr:TRAP transporter substrate-binding protein [Pseudomonadota bacterium]